MKLANLATNMKENLKELAANGILKMEFHSQKIDIFWIKRKYPELVRKALILLIPLATSHLSEITLSLIVDIKLREIQVTIGRF